MSPRFFQGPGTDASEALDAYSRNSFFDMVSGTLLGRQKCENGLQNGNQNRRKSEKNRGRNGSAKIDAEKCEICMLPETFFKGFGMIFGIAF